jgi:hypothetical protein
MEAERKILQADLHDAATNQKSQIAAGIKGLNGQIFVAKHRLAECIATTTSPDLSCVGG